MADKFDFERMLPDFGKMQEEIVAEIKERVERRTPRSNLNKEHAQDVWEINKRDDGTHITNKMPYVVFLENGTSKMAPHYMVKTTLEEVPEIIQQAWERAQKE